MRYDKIGKLFLLLVLFSFNLSAQTVTTISGYPVIDLSALSPLGAVLSSSEASARRTQMNQQTPSNTNYLGVGYSVSGHNGTWNAKMSVKFQVMCTNTTQQPDWATAYNECKNYDGEGGSAGQWRLPTQGELMIILILHPQLIGKGSFTALSPNTYWSSSENDRSRANCIGFHNASSSSYDKVSSFMTRCVRDL